MKAHKFYPILIVLLMALVAFSACAPQTIEKQVQVEVTKVVEKQVTQVIEKQVTQQVVVTATPAPPKERTLPIEKARISVSSKLINLDPLSGGQGGIITVYLSAGRLLRLKSDFTYEPELAESLTTSDDGLNVTVVLKPGLKYSDGTPITSGDIAYAYQRQKDLQSTYLNTLGPIESIETPNDTTAVIKFTTPFPNIGIALSHMVMSLHPKSQVEGDKDYWNHPVSSGQYVLQDWTPGASQWTLVENPNYVFGPSAIRTVEVIAVADATSRVLQLATGALDYSYDLPMAARTSFPPEVDVHPVDMNGTYYIPINMGLPDDHPLKNRDVRRAISLALDREEITQKAFFGLSKPVKSILYSGASEMVPTLENDGQRDLASAKTLLATTPFANGFTFTIQPWGQRPGWTDAALVIKQNLSELGITVEVQPVEDAVASANLKAGNYEAQFSGAALDPLTLMRFCFVPGNTWADFVRYNNPQVTEVLDRAQSAVKREDYMNLMAEAQRLVQEDLVYIPISERVVLVGNRVGSDILYEGNRQPGLNPAIKTMLELGK